MYPHEELTFLAGNKAALRERIFMRRAQLAAAAAQVARPLRWFDRALAQWRRLSPFVKIAAVPLALLVRRRFAPRTRVLGAVLRWGPLVLGAVRGLTATQNLSRRS